MKKMRIRMTEGVDETRLFSASIRGGARGFADAVAIESHSNEVVPTIKAISGAGLPVIVEPHPDIGLRKECEDGKEV